MKELNTVYEIADIFNVSPPTIYKWIEKGLPTTRVTMSGTRSRLMIDSKDVEKFIKEATK